MLGKRISNWASNQTRKNLMESMIFFKKFIIVTTPLWPSVRNETHTPKVEDLKSSGTPENSELDCRGQNTSHWGVLDIIGKVSKCRCAK
jgi:hypothetical protein